jgi:hypothetical protein
MEVQFLMQQFFQPYSEKNAVKQQEKLSQWHPQKHHPLPLSSVESPAAFV